MPTVNEVLGGMMDNAIKNPRSTIASLLTTILYGVPMLLALGFIHGKAAAILGGILAAAKIGWGAFFERDPNKTLAMLPGVPSPQMVPSHGVPDDPSAKAVVAKP